MPAAQNDAEGTVEIMRYNTKRHEIEMGNTIMDYITFGEGEKVLVMIPGLSFKTVRKFAEAFSLMYRIFGKEYTVYAFDRKRQLPIGYTIKNMADDLSQAMQTIGIEKADVLGISQLCQLPAQSQGYGDPRKSFHGRYSDHDRTGYFHHQRC